jgi:hypothetical protein
MCWRCCHAGSPPPGSRPSGTGSSSSSPRRQQGPATSSTMPDWSRCVNPRNMVNVCALFWVCNVLVSQSGSEEQHGTPYRSRCLCSTASVWTEIALHGSYGTLVVGQVWQQGLQHLAGACFDVAHLSSPSRLLLLAAGTHYSSLRKVRLISWKSVNILRGRCTSLLTVTLAAAAGCGFSVQQLGKRQAR